MLLRNVADDPGEILLYRLNTRMGLGRTKQALHRVYSRLKQMSIFADDITDMLAEHEAQCTCDVVEQLKKDKDFLIAHLERQIHELEFKAHKYRSAEGSDYYERLADMKRVYNIIKYLLR